MSASTFMIILNCIIKSISKIREDWKKCLAHTVLVCFAVLALPYP